MIGTERHESRRIDNQLRAGQAVREIPAPPNSLSLQDDLMRIFGFDKLDGMLVKLGLEEGEAIIHHSQINKAVEKAQSRLRRIIFEIRKQLKYDDVDE